MRKVLLGALVLSFAALTSTHALATPEEPAVQRTAIHTEAYKKREGLGPHLEIMITPPEQAGRKGFVLVEIYNYSKTNLVGTDFYLNLTNQWGDTIDAHITCDDLKGGWSALKWVKVPGGKQVPKVTKVNITNMKMFSDGAREVKMKVMTDLIKK